MKRIAHWTPRYLIDRVKDLIYRRRHPDNPWLTPDSIHLLDQFLKPGYQAVEFGSGVSTLWIAHRVGDLTSVEHNAMWYQKVSVWLKDRGFSNVTYLLREKTSADGERGELSSYAGVLDTFKPNSLDFALVDGAYRETCIMRILPILKSGGLLVLDNADRYLPSNTHTPYARKTEDGPATESWQKFLQAVGGWRTIWTSNGVYDTALFFKP